MKKCVQLTAGILTLLMILGGCGNAEAKPDPTSTTILLEKDGQITYYLVEDFDKDYYKLPELADMAKEEASEFNQNNPVSTGSAVTVMDVTSLEGETPKALIQYSFADDDQFKAFTGMNLYYGTVEDAWNHDFHVKGTLSNPKGTDKISELELTTMGTYSVLYTELKFPVYTDRKVAYLSPGAMIMSDGGIDLTNVEGTAIIIMK